MYGLGRLVFYMDDHQTYFQGSFFQNRTEMKFFLIFEQNHGLPSLKKGCKINIFLSTKTCFLTGWSTNFILRPLIVPKQAKRKLPFLTKIIWDPYFYNPGGLVFPTSWSIYLITCWLHDILIYLLNYCSTGISTYWLNI